MNDKSHQVKLSPEHLKIVVKERNKPIKGKSKSYTWKEAKEIIKGKREL